MGTNETTDLVVAEGRAFVDTLSSIVTKENRNALRVYCPHCGSLIISPFIATYVPSKPYALPLCRQKKDGLAVEKEHVDAWWCVEKMLDFENIGFTHAVEGVKYLVCADCEIGPVGYLSLESQFHYIALSRVSHEKPNSQVNDNATLMDRHSTEA